MTLIKSIDEFYRIADAANSCAHGIRRSLLEESLRRSDYLGDHRGYVRFIHAYIDEGRGEYEAYIADVVRVLDHLDTSIRLGFLLEASMALMHPAPQLWPYNDEHATALISRGIIPRPLEVSVRADAPLTFHEYEPGSRHRFHLLREKLC